MTTIQKIKNMPVEQLMALICSDKPINKARQELCAGMANIEQTEAQISVSPITRRRMELEVVVKIAKALGVDLDV